MRQFLITVIGRLAPTLLQGEELVAQIYEGGVLTHRRPCATYCPDCTLAQYPRGGFGTQCAQGWTPRPCYLRDLRA